MLTITLEMFSCNKKQLFQYYLFILQYIRCKTIKFINIPIKPLSSKTLSLLKSPHVNKTA